MKSLNEDLKTGQFKQIYLLYGEESYLKRQYRERLVRAMIPEGDTMNYAVYEGKNIDIKEVIDLAETLPFFASRRLIVFEMVLLYPAGMVRVQVGNLFQHGAALADDHALVAFPLTVNVHINVDEIGAGALLEALHDHRDAVRDLIAHEQQGLFTDDLCHQFLLRHIGVGIIIKVMGAFYGVAAQGIEQRFTAVLVADADRVDVIEYP